MSAIDPPGARLVVLVDDDGRPCGSAPADEVHHRDTPLHLAFSCWLLDGSGRTMLTRRAATKRTWPGIWTNSFCGHPAPGEPVDAAVHRRARQELGCNISAPVVVLPDFRYRAVMDDGTVENEICPVYVAEPLTPPTPNPSEVAALRWVPYADLAAELSCDSATYSPWMRDQLTALARIGWTPARR